MAKKAKSNGAPDKASGGARAARKPRRKRSVAERLYQKISHTHDIAGCHLWTGDTSKNGYATFRVPNPETGKWTTKRAQRVLMELHLGRPLGKHEHVLHKCGGPKHCMNIDHLAVGSHRENIDDAILAGQMVGRKLDDRDATRVADLLDVLVSYGNKVDHVVRSMSVVFGINQNNVRCIWRGTFHDDVTGMSSRRKAIVERGREARSAVKQLQSRSVRIASAPFVAMH